MNPTPTSPDERPASTPNLDLDRLRDEFAGAWEQGRTPRIEDYLNRVGPAERAPLLRELIVVDALHRRLRGETPQANDYADRFPEIPTAWYSETTLVDPRIGLLPERYRVLAPLGAGGMGAVFRVRDERLGREVAVKVINREYVGVASHRARFLREARAMAAVESDHVVQIFDCGENKEVPYIVMELLNGESLFTNSKRQPRMPLDQLCRLAEHLARGLDAVHARGLVHRDLKPSNVWLERDNTSNWYRAKLLDFGLTRWKPGTEEAEPLTRPGTLFGTPGYMAPEQIEGKEADARADLFSLGCILYQKATGQRAFTGDNVASLLHSNLHDQPSPPHHVVARFPLAESDLIMRLLEKDPDNRPRSAAEVLRLLEKPIPKAHPVPPQKSAGGKLWASGLVALVLVVGLILFLTLDGDPDSSGGGTPPTPPPPPPPGELAKNPDLWIARWALLKGKREVSIAYGDETWVDVRSVDKLPKQPFRVVGLEFEGADLTDSDLKTLGSASLTELQSVGLTGNTRVTDAGLAHLKRFDLAGLDLRGCAQIGDEGMRHVARHRGLTYLVLDGTSITDAGLARLHALTNLEELHIDSIPTITPGGVRALKKALIGAKIEESTLPE